MSTLKRFAASLALSLGLLFAAQPLLAQDVLHCTGCEYLGSFDDQNGDTWHVFLCDECHIDHQFEI